MSPRSTKTDKSSPKKTKQPSLNEVYKQVTEAKQNWRKQRQDCLSKIDEKTARDFDENEANVVIKDILEGDWDGYLDQLTHLVKAQPRAFPCNAEQFKNSRHLFWRALAAFAEFGDKGKIEWLLTFSKNIVPGNCHWDGISKLVEVTLERFNYKYLNHFSDVILRNARRQAVLQYLEVCGKLTSTDVEALQERLLRTSYDGRWQEDQPIFKKAPQVSTPEFWQKWLKVRGGSYCFEELIPFLKEIGGPAVDALHEIMKECDRPSQIRAYLKAFPEVDKEPFVKRIQDAWTLDPEKMARDFIEGKGHGYYPPPFVMMHMMGMPPW